VRIPIIKEQLMNMQREVILVAALIAAACATIDAPTPQLKEARAAVRTAETDPAVLSSAPLELKRATESLDRANRALIDGEPIPEIDQYAYLATRRAQTAVAIAAAKTNEATIKAAEVDRERARADMRTLEAQSARADASVQRAQAAMALQQAGAAQLQTGVALQQADAAARQAAAAKALAASSQAQAANSQAEAAAMQNQAALARSQAEAADARTAALQRELADLQAQKTDRGRVVTLGDVLFEFNRAEVKPAAREQLGKLADFLKEFPERKVLVEGYTDNVGSATYNDQLSVRRAESIRTQLGMLGVGADRMAAVGYGKEFPVTSNNTDTDRAMNRRVEVIISDSDQPVRSRR
jgi:outer membrane protein OmpA-like peptidoglycan-associated protein